MRSTHLFGAGDVRVIDVTRPAIQAPTDAIVDVVASCVCGSDLHHYRDMEPSATGVAMGHEFVGVVTEVGTAVTTVQPGDFVIAPFAWSDGTCDFCREGLYTSCDRGGLWGAEGAGTGQSEAVRVPFADGTLVAVPGEVEPELIPSLLTLSDVYATGWHGAEMGGVDAETTVTVIGDGAVGLLAVLSAVRKGAPRVILMGRHRSRTDLGLSFGADAVVAERGAEGIAHVKSLTQGRGTHVVIEAVGHLPAYEQALGVVRDGGTISRVGVPQYSTGPVGRTLFRRNITLTGGIAPVRAYIPELLPGILDRSVNPGRVFDVEMALDSAPEAYEAMMKRAALKVLLRP